MAGKLRQKEKPEPTVVMVPGSWIGYHREVPLGKYAALACWAHLVILLQLQNFRLILRQYSTTFHLLVDAKPTNLLADLRRICTAS